MDRSEIDKPPPAHGRPEPPASQTTDRAFLLIEHAVYVALGLLLAVAAGVALVGAAGLLWTSVSDVTQADAIVQVIDRLLFVLMLIEVFHTVRVSLRSGVLTVEPFLIVGVIASIRRVLVITLQSSEATHSNTWTPQQQMTFRYSMMELGVLAGLIVVMVASIWLLRRAAAHHPSSDSVSSG